MFDPCFVLQYLVSLHLDDVERAGCFTLTVSPMS